MDCRLKTNLLPIFNDMQLETLRQLHDDAILLQLSESFSLSFFCAN